MSSKTSYLDTLNNEVRGYFDILCSDFPEWLFEYIDTPEMQRLSGISISCGTDYSKMFDVKYWYSNLDHSVGVALIIWNFTHNKKQTLAGLFHDIANPAFKHCIDFFNNDHEKQESIDDRIFEILHNSKSISKLLKRDGIKFEEVDDYKKYPIADNDTPRLSADRFEYTFSSGLTFFRVWNLKDIKECYDNVFVSKNEDETSELCFHGISVCEKYIKIISKLWPHWIDNNAKIAMQFWADILEAMIKQGYLAVDDLYEMSEKEIIERILNCSNKYLSDSFKKFANTTKANDSDVPVDGRYCVRVKSKRRYVIPLVMINGAPVRIDKASKPARQDIKKYLNFSTSEYAYLDFDFRLN